MAPSIPVAAMEWMSLQFSGYAHFREPRGEAFTGARPQGHVVHRLETLLSSAFGVGCFFNLWWTLAAVLRER